MFSKILSNGQPQLLKKALNIYQKQHEAISKNVSNASNENFKRVNTDFSSELNNVQNTTSSLKTSNAKHLSGSNSENSNSNDSSEGSVYDRMQYGWGKLEHDPVAECGRKQLGRARRKFQLLYYD